MFKRKLLTALVATSAVGFGAYSMNASAVDFGATANVNIIAPISVAETTQLNFGTVVADSVAQTDVTIVPDGTGGAISGASTADVLAGTGAAEGSFTLTGLAGAAYTVTFPASVVFSTMTLDTFTSLSANAGTLSGAPGNQDTLSVGATLTIPAGTAPGLYSPVYNITVEYN